MRIFVTGATGVLGSRAVPLMLEAGHEVFAVGRSAEKRAHLEGQGARAVLAGSTGQRVIQESFAPIYADGGDAWLDESSRVQPASYNRTALDAEASAERFTRAGRLGVVLRFGMLYGFGDGFTATLIGGVRRGWFALFGRPDGFCSWAEHEDAARAVVAALGVPAGIYNVVEDEPMRRRELANGLARALSVRPPRLPPRWATPLGGVVGRTIARSPRVSNRKLRGASGWAPKYRTALEGFGAIIAAEQASS